MIHPPPRQHRVHGIMYDWDGLTLILLRADLEVHATRLETALERHGSEVSEERRKHTTDAINNIRLSNVALMDIESERNIATHNAATEKMAHLRTMQALEKANDKIKSLTIEVDNLKRSIQQIMSK